MKRLLISAAAVALMAGTALAADLPVYEPAPVVETAPATWDWGGFYLGVQGGWAWGDADADFDNGAPSLSYDPDGYVVGGHLGFNVQLDQFVIGLEGDVEATGIEGAASSAAGITSEGFIDVDWQASLRARAGVAWDRVLLYGTGGVAYADANVGGGPLGSGPCCGFEDDQWGWTAGAGVDFAATDNFILGVEYRYTAFEEFSGGLAPLFPGVTETVDLETHAVRGRASLKFGSLFGG